VLDWEKRCIIGETQECVTATRHPSGVTPYDELPRVGKLAEGYR